MNKRIIKWTILIVSMLQMAGTIAMSPAIEGIAKAFPEVNISYIQMLMLFPGIVFILSSLVAGKLTEKISKKNISIIGLCLFISCGVLSFLFHSSIVILYVWRGVLGFGLGLFVPTTTSMIGEYFDKKEQGTIMGLQSTFVSLGAAISTVLGGMLVSIGWEYNALIYFIGMPALILCIFALPTKKPVVVSCEAREHTEKKIPKFVFLYTFVVMVFTVIYMIFSSNISLLIVEENFGNSTLSGISTAIMLFGGGLMGLLFGPLNKKIGEYILSLSFMIMAIGWMIVYAAPSYPIVLVGAFLTGSSLCIIVPRCFLAVSIRCNPIINTMCVSLLMVAGNAAGFISPIIINPLGVVISGTELVRPRFMVGTILSIIMGVALMVLTITENHTYKKQQMKEVA